MDEESIFVFDYKDPIKKMDRMINPVGALQFDHPTYPTFKTLGILMQQAQLELISSQTLNKKLYTFSARISDKTLVDPIFDRDQADEILRLSRYVGRTPKRLFVKAILSNLNRQQK